MKITDVKMEKFSIELTEPFKVAFAEVSHTVSIIVKVETDEGFVGYGEAAPLIRACWPGDLPCQSVGCGQSLWLRRTGTRS